MPRKPEQSQTQRFIDKAKELGCDEDEAAFEERLRKIAKAGSRSEPTKVAKPKRQP